jgi:hypothetical protein
MTQEFKIDGLFFLGKSTIIYGQTGTGKSKLIINILHELKTHIDQAFVISPMEPANGTYSGIVPKPLIHYKLSHKLLDDIWTRQEMLASLYAKANKLEVLESLFLRIGLGHIIAAVKQARACHAATLSDLDRSNLNIEQKKSKREEIETDFKNFYTVTFKKFINEHKSTLLADKALTSAEKFALDMINFNHKTVIILDDCAADLQTKEMKKSEVLTKIFYMGRHIGLTVLIACQDPTTDLSPNFRKNANASIFCTPEAALCYFDKASNGYRYKMREVESLVKSGLFGKNHQKLIFIRVGATIEMIRAKLFDDFNLCNASLSSFCADIELGGDMINKRNPFFKNFCDIYPELDK